MIRKLSDLDSRELGTLFEVEYEMLPILHSVGIMLVYDFDSFNSFWNYFLFISIAI